jgi:hypothetical protein
MRWVGASAFMTVFGVLACSGGSSNTSAICTSKGSCPNSAPPTPSEMAKCQGIVGDPKCGDAFLIYFDCAAKQEKCTAAGVTDDGATRAAIAANCAEQAASYRSCAGGSSPPPAMCGFTGLSCCTDGSPPCASTACCDPTTNKCQGPGSACTATGTVCAANQCVACGAPGEPCCQIFGTTETNACPRGGCCNYAAGEAGGSCIAEGGMCDSPGPMSVETVCRSGSCITCGSTLGSCCARNKCADANTVCSASNAMCMPCGASNELCCDGDLCPTAKTLCTGGMCP